MYTVKNYRTKKELKDAVSRGERVTVYQPGPFGGNQIGDGVVYLEGPHYPEPHRWYAEALLRDGLVIRVK